MEWKTIHIMINGLIKQKNRLILISQSICGTLHLENSMFVALGCYKMIENQENNIMVIKLVFNSKVLRTWNRFLH